MCTIERVLADARLLVNRLKDHDGAADTLIAQSSHLHQRVEAMKEYQEDLNELNEIARHRPRANLVISIAQENNQIRELQNENRELGMSLEEHQSALELIMSKYRDQVVKLLMANKKDKGVVQPKDQSQELAAKMDKLCEMAAVMQHAATIDDKNALHDEELLAQLQTENQTLRGLLQVSSGCCSLRDTTDRDTQTDGGKDGTDGGNDGGTDVQTDGKDTQTDANDDGKPSHLHTDATDTLSLHSETTDDESKDDDDEKFNTIKLRKKPSDSPNSSINIKSDDSDSLDDSIDSQDGGTCSDKEAKNSAEKDEKANSSEC